tara:strand:+ start:169 stop:1239 length:1071 start_codon:yes stop_codon:yes gene_type:complete
MYKRPQPGSRHQQFFIGVGLLLFGLVTQIGFLVLFGVFSLFSYFKQNPLSTHPIFSQIKRASSDFFHSSNTSPTMETLDPRGSKNLIYYVIGSVLFFFIIFLLSASWVIIGPGETGVQSLFGKVRDTEFSSGFHIKNPFVRVDRMNIRTQDYTMSIVSQEGKKSGNDSITALTKEGLEVGLDMTVLYNLEENKASELFKDVGVSYDDVIIRPQIRSVIREVIATYETKDIYSEKRSEASREILQKLQDQLQERGIVVQEVLLRNVGLPAKLSQSIEQKLSAEQDAERYDFLLQKEEKEAERKRVEARGQRDAQKIINESLSERYLQFLYIQNLQDREGTIYVPTSPNNGVPMFRGV